MLTMQQAAQKLTQLLDIEITERRVRDIVKDYPVSYAYNNGVLTISEETLEEICDFIERTSKPDEDLEYPPQADIWRMAKEIRERTPRPPVGLSSEYNFPFLSGGDLRGDRL